MDLLDEAGVVVVEHDAVSAIVVGAAGFDQHALAGLDPEAVLGVGGEFAVSNGVLDQGGVAGQEGQAVAEGGAAGVGEDAAVEIRLQAGGGDQHGPVVGGDG